MRVTIKLSIVLFLLCSFGFINADRLSKVLYIEYSVLNILAKERGIISGDLLDPKEDISIEINKRRVGLKRANIVVFLRSPKKYLDKIDKDHTIQHRITDRVHKMKYQVTYNIPGEICVVSGAIMTIDDVTLLIKGRRIPFKTAGIAAFMNNPEKYISKLQAKGSFISEPDMTAGGISYIWFYIGVYVLWSLVFSALSANTALMKGLSIKKWFIIGLLTNIVGYIYLLTRKTTDDVVIAKGMGRPFLTTQPISCPDCGYENHPVANKCLECGKELTPKQESDMDRLKK